MRSKLVILALAGSLTASSLNAQSCLDDLSSNDQFSDLVACIKGELVSELANELAKNHSDVLRGLKGDTGDGVWPAGAYCILQAGGSCPNGFQGTSGNILGIWTFRADNGYLKESQFGDSKIQHHGGGENHTSSNWWHGDIIINACCKSQ